MVSLLGLNAYSPEQLEQASQRAPAFKRYQELLPTLPLEDLHHQRIDAWLRCVLATYFATATTEAICASWSDFADHVLRVAWQQCGLDNLSATLLALGKHGSRELNLSSDIDLIVVSDPKDAYQVERGIRKMQSLLQSNGNAGFVFRLDFDLRPGGKMGPLVTTPSQFQDHYWSQGETWERLALVRARAVAGDEDLGRQILGDARKFSYRKFLDFTLLEDLKALRSQVHQKGFQRREGEIHLKLEVGGIRDIELFTQSLLVLNGGKLPELQMQSTSAALTALAAKKILPQSEADELIESYWHFRHLENWVQSLDDRQTHSLTPAHIDITGLVSFEKLSSKMGRVDKIVSSLLGRVDLGSVHLPQDLASQIAWLEDLGFSPEAIRTSWEPLINATALSYKNDRDERARQQFLYTFTQELSRQRALDRDMGLGLLLDFVRATRAKATFFTMLLSSTRLIQDLARLFCLSPYLGSIIASRPELLDHFILQVDEQWALDMEALLQQMAERKLLSELWSANQFLSDQNLTTLGARVTETADMICAHLLARLKEEFPGSGIEIVAMGKWAGRELGLRSDLDFVFVSPKATVENDFKVARRFLSRLTDPARGGSLYDIDLRLRPSGQSGALLVTVEQLHAYWQNVARPWERQAYLRAHPLNSQLVLDKQILRDRGLSPEDLAELKDIRLKLLRKPTSEVLEVKYAPGGLIDIELVTQTAILLLKMDLPREATSTVEMIRRLAEQSSQWESKGEDVIEHYNRLRTFEQFLRLSSTHKLSEAKIGHHVFKKAAALLNHSPTEMWTSLSQTLASSRSVLNDLDPTGLKIHSPD